MPYFLIGIQGNADRGAGLLAKAGIQNIASSAHWMGTKGPDQEAPVQGVTARLRANDAETAVRRVRDALRGEPFTIEDEVVTETGDAN